ncbi:MAG: mechanosensitive ion channel domain-containing protein [Agriterribacter sp.]
MKSLLRFAVTTTFALLFFLLAAAQDTSTFKRDYNRPRFDSSRRWSDSSRPRRNMTLFADSTQLTTSDYQLQIEKSYVLLEKIDNNSDLGPVVKNISKRLRDSDSVLAVVKDNITNNNKALTVRDLEMYRTLLQYVDTDLQGFREKLDSAEAKLGLLKKDMRTLMTDTIVRQMMQDSALRKQFSAQMKEMRNSWRSSTRHLRESLAVVEQLQTRTSANAILTIQLLEKTENLLTSSTARIFGKEYNYIWEKPSDSTIGKLQEVFDRAHSSERKALGYYFKDSGSKRLLLLLIGLIFFAWIYRNITVVRKRNALGVLEEMDFTFVRTGYIVSSFVVLFIIAPLFDLRAPAAYIESMQLLLVLVLTIICWTKWPRKLFVYWACIVLLFVFFSFMNHIIAPGLLQRTWLIILNIASIVVGSLFLNQMRQYLYLRGFIRFVIILHNIMNGLAIVCNIFGRFTLAQTLGNTAIFSFTQAIGLAVFSKICMEAILLQIATSRIVRGRNVRFNYQHVLEGFRRPLLFLIVVLWLIVFTTNLNIYSSLLNGVMDFLNHPRSIGNASFSFGSILLFFFIIWMAHLLQKYIGYFFGETGEDDDIVNKGKRSRLLITKLVLLCAGYFLAIAASGLPVDKITIVLGALGVGIGLGLQSIVNNFVSGIVLIFDRPIQIGDSIEIGNKAGRVKEINLRSSTLLTPEGAEVIIPNGDMLTQHIVNWTLSNNQQRLEMDLTISGSTDMEKVATAVKKTILLSEYIYENREPQVLFTGVNEDGFDLKVFFWSADVYKSDEARSEILLLLHSKLKELGLVVK